MKKIVIIVLLALVFSCKKETKNNTLTGSVFGTSYSIIHNSNRIYKTQLDSLFAVINKSLSTYQTNSDISKLNRNEAFEVDGHFMKVYDASKEIFGKTEGAFDPTIGNVVNAWKFGAENIIEKVDSLKIDSLMQYVGYDKTYRYENTIRKSNPNVYLEFNAIAKGYAVDVVSEFLESKNIENYLVEIGGEIRAKGINTKKQSAWKVGVEEPNFEGEQVILRAVTLTDEAMATSGTYRKFKIDEAGNRYAHIIDTETGYPSKTNLLSISVIAKSCMTADAYATAFKAMGIDRIKTFLEKHPELKVFLIFENDENKLETLSLNGFPE
ncbi:FAD:protein FMN transferase [Algibacter amylolyticus]|uniref:FAD:protein FMN transferase n=1 Tax=Algibacter amylolyticus TaxID=1608400 RepID=A0A5M7B486_9FLAO|nr:FAD:protein FMN transferase [Algibacter amylolyticus]KAA5824169.1 FAD:protein FMN transferase [Algibacter amylolyticus]MBB5269728.1 thiamine biosynthesis lipoprotein [Algibacter amylolyticus]TSJ74646.1 FAD:protein FMN transferase [Algibacter amylolyticus]